MNVIFFDWVRMDRKFSGQLNTFMRRSGLPLRRVASQSGIPHQTIYNWLRGSQPRWYAGLPGDMHRLGAALNLSTWEITRLLQLAGCMSQRPGSFHRQDVAGKEVFEEQEALMESSYRIPKGWFVSGEAPGCYEMGVDPTVTFENRPCVTIKSRPEPRDFATLMQVVQAVDYLGKRVRFSAAVRSVDVENWAGLWMRVDGPRGIMLAFDNMMTRPITSTQDWSHYAVVLDVAEDAGAIFYGVLLEKKGQIWMADVHLDEVGLDIPTTNSPDSLPPVRPVNLGFDE